MSLQNNPPYSRTLSSGTITITRNTGTIPFDQLFDIAERRNPKRAFLFVSKVLGRHIPVSPAKMRSVFKLLSQQFPSELAGPVLFIGMAETAVGLGAGIFDQLKQRYRDSIYLTSTRHPVEGQLLCEFKEAHSHATDHLIYLPTDPELRRRVTDAKTVVLIDDEATTGNTFINLLAALRNEGGLQQISQVITVTLTDWSDGALSLSSPLPIHNISLVSGNWSWTANPDAPIPEMPHVNVTAVGSVNICGKQTWGRLGMATPVDDLGQHVQVQPGEKILVLGTSEFVWQPYLLAERLEALGAEVKFSSTTRSPIAQGYAIKSALSFTDNYGLGIPNFVYNVIHQTFDRILLCCETPVESIDQQLIDGLKKAGRSVEIISYE